MELPRIPPWQNACGCRVHSSEQRYIGKIPLHQPCWSWITVLVYCRSVAHLDRSPKWALTIYWRTVCQSTANWTTSRKCSIFGGIKLQNCRINRIIARSNSNKWLSTFITAYCILGQYLNELLCLEFCYILRRLCCGTSLKNQKN